MWIYRYLSITLTTTWTTLSINVNGGIFGVVTHSGLFRGHLLPGTKIRNDTFGTYFLVQQLTTNQWHIVWLYLSIVKLIPCTENLFVAFVLHGNIKTTGLLRSGFSLGDLRYASSLWRKVHGRLSVISPLRQIATPNRHCWQSFHHSPLPFRHCHFATPWLFTATSYSFPPDV